MTKTVTASTNPAPPENRVVLHHQQPGRSRKAIVVLVVVWAVLAVLFVALHAAWWIIALLFAATLPLLIDIVANRTATLTLSDDSLHWQSGRRQGRIDLSEIDHIRLDTRLDMTVRASAVLSNRRKIRLPAECTPPSARFETALKQANVKTQRHHFSLL